MTEQRAGITLAYSYLYLFRRVVVGLAIVGAVLAWTFQLPALMAAFVCVGIGELLESSYYISVLRWRQRSTRASLSAPTSSALRIRLIALPRSMRRSTNASVLHAGEVPIVRV